MNSNAGTNRVKEIIIKDFYEYSFIIQEYYKLLHRYASLVIPCKKDAEEIVTQVLLNLWKERNRLTSDHAIRIYLKKHTKRQCMAWLYSKIIDRKKQIS